ncbi:MAG: methyltransferase domain-containing protein [Actinobacteria bacterium]|nr:methyltransferase domain-containing protein [Actinomycetota bacterium]
MSDPNKLIQEEFDRAATLFAERTKGRFDTMDAVGFSRVAPGATVLEVGAGTANFLSLFEEIAGCLIAVDLTHGMLATARSNHPDVRAVQGDGRRIPVASRTVDLVATAQALHHIHEPVPVLTEMGRIARDTGHVLMIDQVASERLEEALAMNELELIRDPSHAISRPPSALRVVVQKAGLEIVDERLWEGRNVFSQWMWPGEFPEDRIERVRKSVEEHGAETGMDFRREDGDWSFRRRRMMILARRGG